MVIHPILILNKRQKRQKREQREAEMAAAAEHTEEHTAQIHYKEDAQFLSAFPIEPQTRYQEDNINNASDYSGIKE